MSLHKEVALEAAAACGLPYLYASADGPVPPNARWTDEQWDAATLTLGGGAVLLLDEVHVPPQSKLDSPHRRVRRRSNTSRRDRVVPPLHDGFLLTLTP